MEDGVEFRQATRQHVSAVARLNKTCEKFKIHAISKFFIKSAKSEAIMASRSGGHSKSKPPGVAPGADPKALHAGISN